MVEVQSMAKGKDGLDKGPSSLLAMDIGEKKITSRTETQITGSDMPKSMRDIPEWNPPPSTNVSLDWAGIKTVDLSLYDTPEHKGKLISTVSEALQNDGFFYVVGHGISPETLSRQFALGQLTFDGVSGEDKEIYQAPIAEKGSYLGYKLLNYWEIADGVRDRIEHYNFGLNNMTPLSRFPETLRPHIDEIKSFLEESRKKVLRRVLSLIDGVLGLEDGCLWSLHEDEEHGKSDDYLRYMLYEPLTLPEAQQTKNVMLQGHTDFRSITILVSQPVTGLQILMPDGVWRYVKHKEGALVINIGDQLSFMSGGVLKGTIHRVIRAPEDQAHLRRLGVFHFATFRHDTSLDLLPSGKVHEEGHTVFDGPVPTAGDWAKARVKSYGTVKLVKGEKWDTEYISGLQVRHYH